MSCFLGHIDECLLLESTHLQIELSWEPSPFRLFKAKLYDMCTSIKVGFF